MSAILLQMNDVTKTLSQIEQGDQAAAEQLLPLVYEELRKLAAAKMAQESPNQTLQATALVHEAYLRLVDNQDEKHWDSRGHFFAAATESMRRILIERARRKKSLKHGGDRKRVDLDDAFPATDSDPDLILKMDAAISAFEKEDGKKAELIRLRYFAGLPLKEAAAVMGISAATAGRYWAYARAWLFKELTKDS